MNIQITRDPSQSSIGQVRVDHLPTVFRGREGFMTARVRPEDSRDFRGTDPDVEVQVVTKITSFAGAHDNRFLFHIRMIPRPGTPARRRILEIRTSACPGPSTSTQNFHLPLSAQQTCHHPAINALGKPVAISPWQRGEGGYVGHYLEPLLSDPGVLETPSLLLIPLVSLGQDSLGHRLTLMADPERGWRLSNHRSNGGDWHWSFQTILEAGCESRELVFSMVFHGGDPSVGWKAFHETFHAGGIQSPGWMHGVKTHYFDFLSADPRDGGKRGNGYEACLPHFREFRVGLATQHGYYPHWGDYLAKDRNEWTAMKGDVNGPVPMGLDRMKARIDATRRAGSRAGIYLHLAGFDRRSPLDGRLAEAQQIGRDGNPVPFPWDGPDMDGQARFLSIAHPAWREHLLEQARLVMEILDPDAIVMDETFAGLGYDFRSGSPQPLSPHAIPFFKSISALVSAFGNEKAFLTSDCGMAPFVQWAHGEGGDHLYPSLAAHPHYRETPVTFRAALGSKAWLPCGWLWQRHFEEQMDLARKAGAALAISTGWLDHGTLGALAPERRDKYLKEISTLP